jgi:hypothetical protein
MEFHSGALSQVLFLSRGAGVGAAGAMFDPGLGYAMLCYADFFRSVDVGERKLLSRIEKSQAPSLLC